ncbi:MAG: hypothetical protein GEV28_31940 [Actinophytocola sp.]|uniref:hypothetical protein n=1 Tax=Actinophytocola sp. TaxID=1872138 RepID=UPI00132783AA|nr:hypothetical protein [Actinophytocola sp.]MPZ84748.1 hypothetical protein [Actinophytocola sp.]
MSEPDNLDERVTRLERDMADVRQDAAAARVLAGAADRDVSEMRVELRAHTRSLHALRETQVEQGREMREGFAELRGELRGEMREGFAELRGEMHEGFAELRGEIAGMREGFTTLALGQAQITALLSAPPDQPEES